MKKVSFRVRNFDEEQFLTYNIDNEAELDEDLLDFLEDDEPKGIVPIIFEEGEEFDTFSYDVTNKIRLCELSKNENSAELILMVLRSIVMSLDDMGAYQVPLSYLVLHRDYIYINPDYEVEFICIPLVEMQEQVNLNHFLRHFIASLQFDSSEDGDYVARLLSFINNPEVFSLPALLDFVESQMQDKGIEIPERVVVTKHNHSDVADEEQESQQDKPDESLKGKEEAVEEEHAETVEQNQEPAEEIIDLEEVVEETMKEEAEAIEFLADSEPDEIVDEPEVIEAVFVEEDEPVSEIEAAVSEETNQPEEEAETEKADSVEEVAELVLEEAPEDEPETSENADVFAELKPEEAQEDEPELSENAGAFAELKLEEAQEDEPETSENAGVFAELKLEEAQEDEPEASEDTDVFAELKLEETPEDEPETAENEAVFAELKLEEVREEEPETQEVVVDMEQPEDIESQGKIIGMQIIETEEIIPEEPKQQEEIMEFKMVEIPETISMDIVEKQEPEESEEPNQEEEELEALAEEADNIIANLKKRVVSAMDTVTNDNSVKESKKPSLKTKETPVVGVVIQDELDEYLAEKEQEELHGQKHVETALKIKKDIKVNRASIVKENQEEAMAAQKAQEAIEPEESGTEEDALKSLLGAIKNMTATQASCYLLRKSTKEKIMITRLPFRIGKATMGVDYTVKGNGAVSRVHAFILVRDDTFYIRDNKSTNHTFVNGKMVADGVFEELKDGSKITLGDEDFVFKLVKNDK